MSRNNIPFMTDEEREQVRERLEDELASFIGRCRGRGFVVSVESKLLPTGERVYNEFEVRHARGFYPKEKQ
jgi:hypothetical protein